MKILLYSDLHISKTSSILPLNFSMSKFSFRQNMIIETGKFLVEKAKEYDVDLIINLGDTFDVHTITSYDVTTAGEFFKCFAELDKPHFVVVGNHEMINQDFNAIAMLDNVSNITIIKDPISIELSGIKFAFLPYCNYRDILEFPDGDILFSHQDIQGSKLRGDIVLEEGIKPDILKKKYKLVFNGHIHKSSIIDNVVNVGSITTHSFADDEESIPQCYIYNTDTMELTPIKSNICPLFRKFSIGTLDELEAYIFNLNKNYNYIINCTCPFDLKDSVKEYLTNCEYVLNFKLSVTVDKNKQKLEDEDLILQKSNIDIIKSFKEFLNTVELKFPKELYFTVLDDMDGVV